MSMMHEHDQLLTLLEWSPSAALCHQGLKSRVQLGALLGNQWWAENC